MDCLKDGWKDRRMKKLTDGLNGGEADGPTDILLRRKAAFSSRKIVKWSAEEEGEKQTQTGRMERSPI